MHHTLTGIRPTFLHPSSFPPSSFSQGATSHALGKQTPTEPFQKNSMKSKLFGNTPPHTGTPTGHSNTRHPNKTPACTTPSQASAPPSCILPSFTPFLLSSRHHFPCSWQTNSLATNPPPPHRHPNRHPNRTQACTTPSKQAYPPRPSCILPSFPFLLFLKAPLPMLLARRHQHSHFKKV